MSMKRLFRIALFVMFLSGIHQAQAGVSNIEITSRAEVLGGEVFGKYGPYELIQGRVYFSFDPSNPMNQRIVDLEWAPLNKQGRVEASSNFVVLKPVDNAASSGVGLVEVSNRGGKFTPSYFNRATSGSMSADNPDWFGNGLVMRQGLTVIWVGWQFDVPPGNGNLTLEVPVAEKPNGEPITGLVRSDWVVDERVKTLKMGHRDQIGYPVSDPESTQNVLTRRHGREARRIEVPGHQWRFGREQAGTVVDDDAHIYMKKGFEPGWIYELVYRSANPPVVGLGLAVIRDIISYAKYNENSLFPVEKGIAAGVSQTGRFLRHFLYQGFNTDEHYRPAYDGMMIITAGAGRGSFNHRFAQPSRDAHRYSAFFYPTDIFPFTSRKQFDPQSWSSDGLLEHLPEAHHAPKTFYINTGYEYWGRAASLIHTNVKGTRDVEPCSHERIYHLSSGQHFVDRFPPAEDMRIGPGKVYRGNPLEFKVNYRALLVALKQWVHDEEPPPASQYPTISSGELIPFDRYDFPDIPGVLEPGTVHTAYRVDYGPRWGEGIIDLQPPRLGPEYPSMVCRVNELGNETAGIKNIEVRVPLATHTPWCTRKGYPGSPFELVDFRGSFIPLPLTDEEKKSSHDPRPSIESLYQGRTDYLDRLRVEAQKLVNKGFLLEEDIPYVEERGRAYWEWIHQR